MLRLTQSSRPALSLVSIVIVGLASTSLLADTRPTDTAPAPSGPTQTMMPGTMMPGAGSYNRNDNDFPSPEVRDWVMGATDSARTRTIFRDADSALDAGYRRAQAHFENSHDYVEAREAEEKAYADYTAARDHALASLANNSRYHEIVRLRDETGAQLEARRADRSASKVDLAALATLKMQYASDAHALETQAIDSNPDVKSARDRMVSAGRKTIAMRASFNDSLHDDPQITQLRHNKEQARLAMITADAYTVAASLAADASLWYGSYLHRNDQGYYAPWGPAASGYGYTGGYYSPYWGR